jgi:hypothetical protein
MTVPSDLRVREADEALHALRRTTLGRSARSTVQWLMRAIGWGSIVYLIAWSVVLVVAAVQSLDPLPPTAARPLLRWLPAAGSIILALALHLAARAHVTPVWLDRRDLAHLVPSAASPAALLRWPAWRALLAPLVTAAAVALAVALTFPRLLGVSAPAALLTLPALALLLPTLRWRAALRSGRDRTGWTLVALAWAAAVTAVLGARAGADAWAAWLAAPAAATVGALPVGPALAIGAAALAAAIAFAGRTVATTTSTVPSVVLRQSLQLGELRAIATLRGIAAMTMTDVDPGAGFAAARLRDELRGRRDARSPRWRPPLPRRGGAAAAFAWLGVVRAWRSSPWTVLALLPACLLAVAAIPPGGPFGGASLAPSLALAWVAAQLHPGRVPWPGFAVDGRARTLAALLLVAVPTWLVATVSGLARPALGLPVVPDDWLVIPLALAAGAVVDILAGRAATARSSGVWLTAAVLVAAPAALLGWFGLDAGVATPVVAGMWIATAWLRVLAAPPVA